MRGHFNPKNYNVKEWEYVVKFSYHPYAKVTVETYTRQ